jgi:hypothetical protein
MQNVMEKIQKGAQENVSEVRFIKKIEIGQVIRQGDIYIHRVSEDHNHGTATKNRQLAIGTSQGSRHILVGDCEIFEGTTAPEWCASNVFLGPFFKLKNRAVVEHPEHAYVDLPGGYYQITHQMDARTLRRVAD